MSMSRSADIVIVGAGPIGLSLAIALTRFCAGLEIVLIERRALSVPRDGRASTIAAGVQRSLEALGIWASIADGAQPVRALKLTDSGETDISRPVFLDFAGDVAPGEPFAHLVPNTLLVEALIDNLPTEVSVLAPAAIAHVERDARHARVVLESGETISTQLVVAADGARSALRQSAGIEVFEHDYRQTGIVATFAHERDHEGVAWQHFRPSGPIASLPLLGRRSSLVWTETSARADDILALPPQALARELEAAMGSVLGAISLEDKASGYPLRLQIARSFIAERLALVGDAAHVIHPIAGQGLNLGLKDVAALAQVVVEAVRLGLDAGDRQTLSRYESWRRMDTMAMAAATDGLNRLFSNDSSMLRGLRDLGLSLVDRTGLVKDVAIRAAAAASIGGPRLLSGQPI